MTLVDSCPTHLRLCLSVYPNICLSFCHSVDLSIRLPACLNLNCGQRDLFFARSKLIRTRVALSRNFRQGKCWHSRHIFPVVKNNYLCADFCSRQFMKNWSLLLSWNFLNRFYSISFET